MFLYTNRCRKTDDKEIEKKPPQKKLEMTNVDEVDRVDYRFEAARLNSFATWRAPGANIRRLANAGFYYTEQDNLVRCFECKLALSITDEDPSIEHQRWSGTCRFLRGLPCGNVPIGTDPETVTTRPRDECGVYGIRYQPNAIADIRVHFDDTNEERQVSYEDLMKAEHPQYARFEDRLRTFDTWPAEKSQMKHDLADAGFFYTKCADRTLCYYCGGGLEKWEPHDVPSQEHYKWFSKCDYILRKLRKVHCAANM